MYNIKRIDLELNTIADYLEKEEVLERLGIPKLLSTAITTLRTKWLVDYAAYKIVNNRTPLVTADFLKLRVSADAAIRKLHKYLRGIESFTEFLPDDRKNLFVPVLKKHTSIGIPTLIPQIDVIGRAIRTIMLQITYPALPEINYTKLPVGVSSINIYIAIVAVGSPVPTVFATVKNFAKVNIDLAFNQEDEEKVVYIKAAYLNAKGDEGPISDPINLVVPN